VLGELDGGRSQAAGAGVDEDLLAGLDVGAVDECLPGGQGDQRHRGRLVRGERVWFGRDVVLVDRDVLREGPDPQVAGRA
jgi:hypothetical protein